MRTTRSQAKKISETDNTTVETTTDKTSETKLDIKPVDAAPTVSIASTTRRPIFFKKQTDLPQKVSPTGVASVISEPQVESELVSRPPEDTITTDSITFSNVNAKRTPKGIEKQGSPLRRTLSFIPKEQTEFGYLTTKIKSTSNFQTRLGNLAASDFRHDFHINVKTQDLMKQFSAGLPSEIDNVYDEDTVLDSIINLGELQVESFKQYLVDKLKPESPGIITVMVPPEDNENKITTFQVIKYAKENYDDSIQKNFGIDFCDKTGICQPSGNAFLIVDFNQHGFISKLKEGDKSDNTIHYLVTPEVVNDPAPKPSVHDVLLFGSDKANKGVNLISYVQTDALITNYTEYKETDTNFNNNFFTKYNFSIHPITQIFQKGTKSTLNTTLNITYNHNDPKRLPFTSEINDSKKQNSKSALNGFIDDVISSVKKTPNNSEALFEFNSKLQQKRSGDWFQGLCCLDVNQKKFSRVLPNPERDVKLIFNGPIYLLTHDRIALAYALCNGVNTIYLANDKTTYVFKNSVDPLVKSSMKPIDEIRYEKIKIFCENEEFVKNTSKKTIYTDARNNIIKLCKDDLYGIIQQADDASSSFEQKTNRDLVSEFKLNFKKFINKYQNLFTSAVELQFILNTLIDIEDQWVKISEFKTDITSGINFLDFESLNEKQKSEISLIDSYISAITLAFNKLDINAFDPNNIDLIITIEQRFVNTRNNLIKLLKKTNIYKTAAEVLTINSDITSETIPSFVSRLLNFAEKDKATMVCDQFIFLSAIQTMCKNDLEKEDLKKIVDCLENLKKIVIKYGKGLEEMYPIDGRRKVPDEEKTIFFRSANLVYESLLLLKVEEKKSENIISRVVDSIVSVFTPAPTNMEKLEFKEVLSEGSSEVKSIKVLNESTDVILVNTTNKQRRINISKIGKQSDMKELTVGDIATSAGGGLEPLAKNKLHGNAKFLLIYDTISDQTTFQLMSNFNDLKPQSKDIEKYYKVLIYKITKGEEISVEEQREEQQELLPNDFDKVVSEFLKINSEQLEESEKSQIEKAQNLIKIIMDEQNIELTEPAVIKSNFQNNLLIFLLFAIFIGGLVSRQQGLIGGGKFNNLITFIPREDISYKELLKDTNFSPHPLLSIYMILLIFYNQFNSDFNSDPFYDTYITYVKILSKMTDVIINDYLNETSDIQKTTNAFFIGYCLRTIFFTANKSSILFDTLCKQSNLTEEECRLFCLKNGMFGSIFGDILVEPGDFEEVSGSLFLNSPLFLDFINNKVNLKEILQTPVSPEEMAIFAEESKFEQQIESILNKIVEKINIDRIGDLSQIDLPLINVSTEEPIESEALAKGVEEFSRESEEKIKGISMGDRKARAELGNIKAQSSPKSYVETPKGRIVTGKDIFKYSQEGVPVTSKVSSNLGGTIKNKKKNKKHTRGKKKNYKNKTIKKMRRNRNKKSIKH